MPIVPKATAPASPATPPVVTNSPVQVDPTAIDPTDPSAVIVAPPEPAVPVTAPTPDPAPPKRTRKPRRPVAPTFRVLHHAVGSWVKGDTFSAEELPEASVIRLLNFGAIEQVVIPETPDED